MNDNISVKVNDLTSEELDFLDKYQKIYIQEKYNKTRFDLRIENLMLDFENINKNELINGFLYTLIKENIAFGFKIPDYIPINQTFLEMVKNDPFFYYPILSLKGSLNIKNEIKKTIERNNFIFILETDSIIKIFKKTNEKIEFINEIHPKIDDIECIDFECIDNFIIYASEKNLYLFDLKSCKEINKKDFSFEIKELGYKEEDKKYYIRYGSFCRELSIKNNEFIIGDDLVIEKTRDIINSKELQSCDSEEKIIYSNIDKSIDFFTISPDEKYLCFTGKNITKVIELKNKMAIKTSLFTSIKIIFSYDSKIIFIKYYELGDSLIKLFHISSNTVAEFNQKNMSKNFEIKLNKKTIALNDNNGNLILSNLYNFNIFSGDICTKQLVNCKFTEFLDENNLIFFDEYMQIKVLNLNTKQIIPFIENSTLYNTLSYNTVKNMLLSTDKKYIIFETAKKLFFYEIAIKNIITREIIDYVDNSVKFSADSNIICYQTLYHLDRKLHFLKTETLEEIHSIDLNTEKFQLSIDFKKIFILDEVKNQIVSRSIGLLYKNTNISESTDKFYLEKTSTDISSIKKIQTKELLGYLKFDNFITLIQKDKVLTFKHTNNGAELVNSFNGNNFSGEAIKSFTNSELEIFSFDAGFIIKKLDGKLYGSKNWKDYVYFRDGDEIKDYPKWERYFDAVWDPNIFEEL